MKTAISLPDDLFKQVDRTAKKLHISRSEVFKRAVIRYLESARRSDIKASYDAAFGDDDESGSDDRVLRSAARRALLSVPWDDR